MKQLGGTRLKGCGVQLVQAIVNGLQALIIWAELHKVERRKEDRQELSAESND